MKTEAAAEKVYVAIGNDLQDGLATLEWTLRKWSSHSDISVVILHADINKDYVYTYYGKLPASYVNDEKLEFLRKCEQGKMDKILHQYISACGKVKAEILNVEKYDEPIHKRIVELISDIRITKLVMGLTFIKSSSWKYRNPINGLKHVQRHKPDYCELFFVSGGRLVSLKEANTEGLVEDDPGVIITKANKRRSLKSWFGKMFPENASTAKSPPCSPSSSASTDSPDLWEKCVEEVECYFDLLSSANLDEEEAAEVANDDILQDSPSEPDIPQNMNSAERNEALKTKLSKAREEIQSKRIEAKENVERQAKAEWAISLCTCRVEELEAGINEETARRVGLENQLDNGREVLHEIHSEVEQKKSKLDSTVKLQRELSNKLKSSSLAKSRDEAQLEKMVQKRAGLVQEIEKLRKQRDVMQRRIEFCREKDAIGMATRLNDLSFTYKEFTADEIRLATDNFSEYRRLKSSSDLTNVFKGRINCTTVAIKLYDSVSNGQSEEAFHSKVKLLTCIQHPHLVAVLGFCSDLKCIVFEYMHEGCLRNALFSSDRNYSRRNHALNWHFRTRIAAEVCSGLSFLHLAKPRPIIHSNLNPSKILLDRNHVAKINGFRLGCAYNESGLSSDIHAFGNLVLQLLTGRNWGARLHEEAVSALMEVLDERAGEWPLELAMDLARIAVKCLSTHNLRITTVMKEIDEVRRKADDLVARGEFTVATDGVVDLEDSIIVPSTFLCPILQDIMKNPHLAADGFSYELEAIEEWLGMGHDTSPMTNLRLIHKQLIPNHTLRSLIHDWRSKRSISCN